MGNLRAHISLSLIVVLTPALRHWVGPEQLVLIEQIA
jgi:hypothetical protein